MKQYIGISRDHSASMASLAKTAMKDYNENIDSIKQAGTEHGIDTVVSVIECGVNEQIQYIQYGHSYSTRNVTNKFVVTNSSVSSLSKLTSYAADGAGTPLFDSLGELIEQLEKVPDAEDSSVSFMVMAITDGQENASKKYDARSIGKKIRELQGTDRWTFVLRVPVGYKRALVLMGIPEGNIQEWETTTEGLARASVTTQQAVKAYYTARASGQRSTTRFYADLDGLKLKDVQKVLTPIKGYTFFYVDAPSQIRDYIESKIGKSMLIGSAFYQLTKPEKVQGHKTICIREKNSGKVYTGDAARDLLGIPQGGEIKLYPGKIGNFDVFIQSTSVNRNLLPGTEVLYWPGA